jgi:hypothetical protein
MVSVRLQRSETPYANVHDHRRSNNYLRKPSESVFQDYDDLGKNSWQAFPHYSFDFADNLNIGNVFTDLGFDPHSDSPLDPEVKNKLISWEQSKAYTVDGKEHEVRVHFQFTLTLHAKYCLQPTEHGCQDLHVFPQTPSIECKSGTNIRDVGAKLHLEVSRVKLRKVPIVFLAVISNCLF